MLLGKLDKLLAYSLKKLVAFSETFQETKSPYDLLITSV